MHIPPRRKDENEKNGETRMSLLKIKFKIDASHCCHKLLDFRVLEMKMRKKNN